MRFDLKKDVKGIVISGLVLVFAVIFISALAEGVMTGNPSNSIEKVYGPSTNISGWVNISFDGVPTDYVFSCLFDGSEGNSISLEDLLDKNPSYEHSCIPLDCGKDYSVVNGESSKTFVLSFPR